jgi:hypothetical protein
MEENSISIINRSGNSLTGEKAKALPIQIMTGFSWIKIFISGVIFAALAFGILFFTVKKQVVTVEVVGKTPDFQVLELK